MLRTLLFSIALLLSAAVLVQQPTAAQDATAPALVSADLPPLIDREVFFGDPEIASSQLSPDGQYLTFRKPYTVDGDDVMNVWIKGIDEPFDAARPLTADARPVPGYFWSEDSRYVLYVQDKGGDENYHVWAVDPSAKADPVTGVPEARDLTPMGNVRAQILATPENTPNEIIVGLNDRDPSWHDVYRLNLETGERTLVVENTERIAGWQTDLNGNVRLAVRIASDGTTEILRVGDNLVIEPEPVYTCTVMEACSPIRYHKDGRHVYMETNKSLPRTGSGGDRDLTELVLFDPATGKETFVERDPEGQVDFGQAIFSDATEELVLTSYTGDRTRLYPKDEETAADLAFLRANLPDGEFALGGGTNDDRLVKVTVYRDVDPGTVYLFNRETDELEKLYASRPELPSEHLAPMQAIRYPARDGMEIPAYLTLPKGVEAKNLPAIIFPHGGPWARDTWGYDSFAQFLANRGYAVLQPNFRGSTGYGKRFLNAGNKAWGTGAMQHDITDGVQYLVEQGIADPERIGIMGGSYGGYATLAGVTFTPDLYAAAVDIVGPSSLITLLESIPPYWEAGRVIFHERMGDPTTEEGRAQLEAQSPLNFADRITTPLLVIQGANDPRVKQREADQIVVALRDRGYPVEYLVAPDEGHGFRGEENRLAMMVAIEPFLAKHLGGRAQQGAAPEIMDRLAAITVDPSTVMLPDVAGDQAEMGTLDPSNLSPTTLQYAARLTTQGMDIPIEATRTVEVAEIDGRAAWRILDLASGIPGAGTITDTLWVDQATLMPIRRGVSQGPMTIALTYMPDMVTGQVQMPGQAMPFEVPLEEPVTTEGALLEVALGASSLEEGDRASFYSFDLQKQKPVLFTTEVMGRETLTVPAGTYDVVVVQLTKGDGSDGSSGMMYFDADRGTLVKRDINLGPEAGGGTMTMELESE